MNRREALYAVNLLFGGAIIGSNFFLSGCKASPAASGAALTQDDILLFDEIAETIIPATPGSGGGKAAKVGSFISKVVPDCYTPEQQKVLTEGLGQFKKACKEKYKKPYAELSATDREAFVTNLFAEAKAHENSEDYKKSRATFNKEQDDWVAAEAAKHNFGARYLKKQYPPHYFTLMRQLTLWGYFTSEEGMTKALRYVETPGHYDGAYPYKKGDKAWA